MPVRIYDIAKKLGLESKEVISKAKALGISAAKVPSSSLDKITAEYLEEQLGGKPAESAAPAPAPVAPTGPRMITEAPPPPAPPTPVIEPVVEAVAPPAEEVAAPAVVEKREVSEVSREPEVQVEPEVAPEPVQARVESAPAAPIPPT